LLQIFLKDASLLYHEDSAGPFFYEVIQRCGHEGFGEGNFRALFEAIEMQEQEA
ncbi:MAG: 4-hydroxyphenylpyruvate dioxygenase, partial [Nitrospinaceae bacterium]|nr:4-hydroxyphenylpyruvate dioxygenase [Nitrospinaceae bacterium]NIR55745.1 4-hydroxyphenylpyruvate dioxygenase [Nitrospinaceae bacterium]NIS86185.1 4-hydroxyphenylpyruvate dioxygenase [Nitrospinaceae bacterium]NIT83024.1 4-hydroxyphenylpyruvate dioxygenase [Nitrospinaceae bacterium]NIU45236.1 4-hydroxyphenylpyruvate dioxygenase [Nitrospinaceae bacterium]